jgi:uncharacterized protein (DUF1800 family)
MKIKFLALVYTLALVSCGGGGGGGAGTPNGSGVSGLLGFHLAAVEGATCILTRSDGTTSSHATNSSGFVDFSGLTIPAGLTQLSCSGGNYKDEATGDIVDPTPTMRAATNYSGSGELRLIASAISEIAFRMAGSNLLADTVDDYNTQVADMLGLDDIDIVVTVPVDMNNVANGNVTAANTPEQRIGMINAALSQIGENQNETMEQVIERMIIEMADGDMSDDVDNDISDAIDDLQNNVNGNGIGNVMDTDAETAISNAKDGTVTVSIAPIANAGADQIVNQGTIVTLDASHSTATTGSIVSYKWSAPTGISLSDNTTQSPTFTALTAGTYSFTLTVANDNNITSATDEVVVIVTIGDTTPPITTASLASGYYNTQQTITLIVNEEAIIYYTTDGTTPTLTSSVYATPIVIDSEGTTILQYFAQDIGGNSESVQSRTYTIDTIAPTTLVNIASGYYNTTQTITLSTTETATIYYTTDGTTPTSASTIYINPVVATMNATTHLQFFAIDAAGNSESVQSKTYTIDNIPPQLSTHKNITIIKNSTVHDDTGTSGVVAPNLNSLTTDNLTTNENLEFKIVNYASIPTDFGVSLGMDAANSENYAKTRPNGNDIHIHPTTDFVGTTTITLLARDEVGNESSPISFVLSIVEGNTDSDGDGVSDATELSMGLNPLSSDDIVTVSSNVPSGCCLFSSCFTMVTTTKTVGVAANLVGGSDNGNLSTINLDKGFLEFNELTGEYSFTPHHNACTEHPYGELCLTSFEYEIGGITHKITLNIDRELEFASSNTTAIIGENKTLVVDPDGEPVNVNITTAPTIGNTTIAKSQATYSSTVNNYVLTNINDFVDSEIDIVKFNVTDINNNTSSKTINITLDLGDDSDNGGIHDVLEDYFGFNKNNVSDDTADNDSDKINNTTEIFLTYNPLVDETLPQTTDADKLNFKVMNRLAFGVNSTLTTQINNIGGIDNWLDDQLLSNQIQTNLDDGKNNNLQDKMDNYHLNHPYRIEVIPTVRPLHADNQLQTLMARFWDNHFNTEFGTHLWGWMELWERDEFYKLALGNFKDLVMFSAKSAVMSRYLNGNTNVKGKPNENFAREIMELHTLGVEGGYTDEDIKQLARIFTGWNYSSQGTTSRYNFYYAGNPQNYSIYEFNFNSANHDDGDNKPFLTTVPDTPDYDDGVGNKIIASRSGADGVIEGEKAIDILAKHPTTAKYLCTKLTKFLVSDNPLEDTINACKNEFITQQEASDQIAKVIKVIFNTDEFKDIASSKRKLKDSQEYYLSIGRLLEIDALKYNAENANSGNLGWNIYYDKSQRFFQKAEPTGYPEVSSQWNKTDIAFSKITQLNRILQDNRGNYKKVDLIKFFKDKNLTTAKEIIEFLLPKITAGYYDGAFVQQAYDILRPNNEVFNINNSKGKLQKLLGFLLASPEFNLH